MIYTATMTPCVSACVLFDYHTLKTKVGKAHHFVSHSTPNGQLVCCGRQIGGLCPPLFLQCMLILTSNLFTIIMQTFSNLIFVLIVVFHFVHCNPFFSVVWEVFYQCVSPPHSLLFQYSQGCQPLHSGFQLS